MSNFSPVVWLWWLRGSNFKTLEDSGKYMCVNGFALEMNHWLKHMQLIIDIESRWASVPSFQPAIMNTFGNDLPWTLGPQNEWSPTKILCNSISLSFPDFFSQRNTMQLEWTLYNNYRGYIVKVSMSNVFHLANRINMHAPWSPNAPFTSMKPWLSICLEACPSPVMDIVWVVPPSQ